MISKLPLFAYLAAYFAIAYTALWLVDGDHPYSFLRLALGFILITMPIVFVAALTLRFLNLCIFVRPKSPAKALYHDMKELITHPTIMTNGIPLIALLFFFFKVFSMIKVNIPVFVPFQWDETFAEWDKALHFGMHPYEILQPVLGHPIITFIINGFYNLWYMVMWTFWIYFAFTVQAIKVQTRFFLSFMMVWSFGGSLAAVLFSSAGPCYYGLVVGSPDPFEPLMSYLYSVNDTLPLWALNTQQLLWEGYLNNGGPGNGISAMPSMHNAACLLFALAAWEVNRTVGILGYIFTAIIFLGSIHLGWHYAIDGYFGFAITLFFWKLSGPLSRWIDSFPAVRQFHAKVAAQA
ncbi:MAG: phosphatase PAP2 family protein [Hyphomicrobiales bacterium]